mmetsp:Transcript_48661/g.134978  ORF Transcript_48661/g.134978 Transcript_48661/m.134978 type:complete len:106 (-) Transcript_48661:991-1308(-)
MADSPFFCPAARAPSSVGDERRSQLATAQHLGDPITRRLRHAEVGERCRRKCVRHTRRKEAHLPAAQAPTRSMRRARARGRVQRAVRRVSVRSSRATPRAPPCLR